MRCSLHFFNEFGANLALGAVRLSFSRVYVYFFPGWSSVWLLYCSFGYTPREPPSSMSMEVISSFDAFTTLLDGPTALALSNYGKSVSSARTTTWFFALTFLHFLMQQQRQTQKMTARPAAAATSMALACWPFGPSKSSSTILSRTVFSYGATQ